MEYQHTECWTLNSNTVEDTLALTASRVSPFHTVVRQLRRPSWMRFVDNVTFRLYLKWELIFVCVVYSALVAPTEALTSPVGCSTTLPVKT